MRTSQRREGRPRHRARSRAAGLGNLTIAYDDKSGHDRLADRSSGPTAQTSATCCATIVQQLRHAQASRTPPADLRSCSSRSPAPLADQRRRPGRQASTTPAGAGGSVTSARQPRRAGPLGACWREPVMRRRRRWRQRRSWSRSCSCVLAACCCLGCKFDGAYDLPLPGRTGRRRRRDHGHRGVRGRRSTSCPAVAGDGRRRHRRRGHRGRAGRLARARSPCWSARTSTCPTTRSPRSARPACSARSTSPCEPPPRAPPTGRLADGDNIPLSATGRNPEVEEVLGALSFLLSGGGRRPARTITTELNKMMDGRTEDLRAPARPAHQTWSARSTTRRATSSGAMESIDKLTATLNRGAGRRSVQPSTRSARRSKVLDRPARRADRRCCAQLDRLGDGRHPGDHAPARTTWSRRCGTSQPSLRELARRRRLAGPAAVDLMASFPFPKEAADMVRATTPTRCSAWTSTSTSCLGSGGHRRTARTCPVPSRSASATPAAPVCSHA